MLTTRDGKTSRGFCHSGYKEVFFRNSFSRGKKKHRIFIRGKFLPRIGSFSPFSGKI